MGIDARILLRHTGTPFTPAELRKMSHSLGSTVGADKLLIPDSSWDGDDYKTGIENLLPISKVEGDWEQDGDPIHRKWGETFYEVHLWSRYYGPGYERGDWPAIRSIIEFFHHNYAGLAVWYGGDSSGVCAELADADLLAEMNAHYYSNGHRPYHGAFGSFRGTPPHVCPRCQEPCADHGGGGGDVFFSCHGCGDNFIVMANGVVHKLPRHGKANDFFHAHQLIIKGEPLTND